MFGTGLLNLGSLIFGLIALILPVVNLIRCDKTQHRNWATLSMASASACAVSLCMQILYGYHLVMIEDWSALMDTSSAVAWAATILLAVTIILNLITLIVYHEKKSDR